MNDELTCCVCESPFDIEAEGGCRGFIGILPVAFCPTCLVGVDDMLDKAPPVARENWEAMNRIRIAVEDLNSALEAGRELGIWPDIKVVGRDGQGNVHSDSMLTVLTIERWGIDEPGALDEEEGEA